ncbi:alpha/beta hydrolase [Burkholderia sp. FERM BP-3421]|jgi:pimeloyl-ACP methyl ester carboxylesterase|uniref:alpha/beta fold hydrolase n=1 Tax=Burkholderia sp. FERM BP-3421 TaxID=1494466 RepID=UPI00235E3EC9|nr:alpha/beta hydrolase [Burkholderia sp. FERM BP-3421]WDD91552.1 alpha/beta hydrolase [Burkholderia sp. FERM BP-3421]
MSNTSEQSLPGALAQPAAPPMPFRKRLVKGYVDALSVVSSAAAARRATDLFGYTRTFRKTPPKDMTPLGARRFEIEGVAGVKHGHVWGKGERTVLLVHGWGADSATMFSFVPWLQKAGFRVAAFDAPAHGVSPGTVTTMTAFKDAVKGAIRSLGGVHAIVAHSLGSIASTGALAELGPASAAGLVMLAPPCTLPAVIDRWSNDFLQLTPPVMRALYAELHSRNGVPPQHWDIGVLGRGLAARMLVMHGPNDDVVPICESENIVAALPGVVFERVEKVGHVRILSDAGVIRRVTQFLTADADQAVHAATGA